MKIEDMMGALRNLIISKFQETTGSGESDALLAFEFGTPFPDDDFRLAADAPVYSQAMAVEVLSRHAQSVGHVQHSLYVTSGLTIENQYEILLRGSTPVNAGASELLGAIKDSAASAFEQTLGSLQGQFRYHPTFATPVNWYEGNAQDGWTHIQINQADQPLSPAAQQPGINPKLFAWRVAPIAVQPMLSRRLSVDTIRAISAASSVSEAAALAAVDSAVAATAPRPLIFARRRAIAAGPGFGATVRGTVANARADFSMAAAHNDPDPPIPVHFIARFGEASEVSLVQLAAATASSGEEKPVAADGFSIDVEMCMVKLSRPWLSDALLTLPGWYVPG